MRQEVLVELGAVVLLHHHDALRAIEGAGEGIERQGREHAKADDTGRPSGCGEAAGRFLRRADTRAEGEDGGFSLAPDVAPKLPRIELREFLRSLIELRGMQRLGRFLDGRGRVRPVNYRV